MPKKMHDILPPKKKKAESKAVTKEVKAVRVAKETPVVTKTYQSRPKRDRKFPLKEIIIGAVIIVLLLAVYGITKLPKADIQISPKVETMTLSQKVTADKSVTEVGLSNGTIGAQYVEQTKEASQEFPATGSGSNDGKASGMITVYNKTTSAFTLIKGTHFLSDSGKYFVTTQKIVIPAMVKKTPGSVSAQVQAQESGSEYNIGPSKFSAPKLYGTAYYYNIYAQSNSAMSGGFTGDVKKVTEDDIKKAKDSLTNKVLQDAKDALKGKITSDDILLDDAITNNTIEATNSLAAGAIADKFSESVKVTISALVFKKQDIEALVKNNLNAKLTEGSNLLEKSLNIVYDSSTVDNKNGKVALGITSSIGTYSDIDINKLVNLFSTKSGDQIKQVVDQLYDGSISELKVSFWPFWVHTAPTNKNRIKINLLFK